MKPVQLPCRRRLLWSRTKATVVLVSQAFLLQSLMVLPVRAQECGSAPDETDAQEAKLDEAAPMSNSTAESDSEPDETPASDDGASADDGDEDGGDEGDGGDASGSVSGDDGPGRDGSLWDAVQQALDRFNFASNNLTELEKREKALKMPVEGLNVVADPINLRLADKLHVQVDYLGKGSAALRIARTYHSNAAVNTAQVRVPVGAGWHMFYDRSLQVLSAGQVRLHRANGRTLDFTYSAGTWNSSLPAGVLSQVAGGWQYLNHRDTLESYDSSGRLSTMTIGGLATSLQYDGNGRLIRVANPFGRSIALAYDASGRVGAMTLPDGSALTYAYDSIGNLASVRFADNTVRQYLYENASFRNALTGLIDESGRRRLTWGYDAQGRPNQSYYGTGLNGVTAVYNGNQVTTTDSRGTQRVRNYGTAGGRTVLASLSTLATADSAATAWAFGYDASGNPSSISTRSGEVQQFNHDSRGRATLLTRAAGTPQALGEQVSWHPTFRKPTRIVSRGVTKDFSIDGAGRVTQISRTAGGSTTVTGSLSYNAQNLLQSATDARGATTTYTYDAAGNRTSATNALGQATYYQNFNAHGQAARVQRADGVVITRTFDTRGRIATRTVAGMTTSFQYDAAGRVTRVTDPDGGWRGFSYDAAGVLTQSTNHRGESQTLTRDAAGVVVNRDLYTSGGALALKTARQFDAVGRLANVTDSRNYRTQYLYANDGRPRGATDPLGLTRTLQLDVLSRPTAVTIPNTTAMRQAGGPATTSVAHGFDGVGNHASTVDTNTVATGYAYDPLNRRNGEAGNDAGAVSMVRNAAGDVVSVTDARGITLYRDRDALGRVTAIRNNVGTLVSYTYVAGRSDGLLAAMTDTAGATSWTYDSAGRVLTQQQTIAGITRNVTIARDAIGRPTNITYPSGMQVAVTYAGDTVSSLNVNGSTLLNNISYLPFSATATGWRWGNNSSYSRSFDADGRVTSVTLGSTLRSYTYDAAGRVSTHTDTGPAGTKLSSFSYDEAGQLIGYTPPTGTAQTFAYDTNGNRRSEVVGGVARTYTYVAGSNRLASISSGLRSYQYTNDGNTGSDGRYAFNYDQLNRLASANTATQKVNSVYNGLGLRTRKTVSLYSDGLPPMMVQSAGAGAKTDAAAAAAATGIWTTTRNVQFVYDTAGHLLGEYNSIGGSSQETVWFNGQPVATMINGVLHYIHADHLGTPRSIVRASTGVELWRWDSDPFGTSNASAPNPTAGTITYNLRFPGQYLDSETGLHYNGMRDYDPRTGRYVQADPIGLGGGLSRYSYVGGNPLSGIDPPGLALVFIGGQYSIVSGLFGYEASGGLYFNTSALDFGAFVTHGSSSGWNIGANLFVGASLDGKFAGESSSLSISGPGMYNLNLAYDTGGLTGIQWSPGVGWTRTPVSVSSGSGSTTLFSAAQAIMQSNFFQQMLQAISGQGTPRNAACQP